jgi:hypothetical protein
VIYLEKRLQFFRQILIVLFEHSNKLMLTLNIFSDKLTEQRNNLRDPINIEQHFLLIKGTSHLLAGLH